MYNNFINEVNPLSANPTKWSNTLKQLVSNLLIFVGLARKSANLFDLFENLFESNNITFFNFNLMKRVYF